MTRDSSFAEFLEALAQTPAVSPALVESYRELAGGGVVLEGEIAVEEEIAAGGMGRVFRGWDRKLERPVALKLVRLGGRNDDHAEQLEAAFEREARATAQLNHPNIVTVHGFGAWQGLPYLVLEMLEGQTLAERLRQGPLPLVEVVAVAAQILRGLEHAHDAGLLHRDLKPQNIFLRGDGVVKIMDFGLTSQSWRGAADQVDAGEIAADETRETLLGAGTPGYMAPEQAVGEAQDERTDLWAVGVLLHEMAAGAFPPTTSTHTGIDFALATSAVPGVADADPTAAASSTAGPAESGAIGATEATGAGAVPAELTAIIDQAIADDPARRFAKAATMRQALEALALAGEEQPGSARPRQPGKKLRALSSAAMAVALAAVVWTALDTKPTVAPQPDGDRMAAIKALHVVRPERDRPVPLAGAPDLRGTWAQEGDDPERYPLYIERRDEVTYRYYRNTRKQDAPASPKDVVEEGELKLYRVNGKQILSGVLLSFLHGSAPQAEIAVEFEIISADRIVLTASFFRGVGKEEIEYFYVDKPFVRLAPPAHEADADAD